MEKSIQYSEVFFCNVIMQGDDPNNLECGEPDHEKLNEQTGQYTGQVKGLHVSGMRLLHHGIFDFYYYTVDEMESDFYHQKPNVERI